MSLRKSFLICGILSSLVYVATDVLAAIRYPGYHSFTARVVSELMATGAPTERLVDPLFLLYGVFLMAGAVGIWMSGSRRRDHVVGGLLFANGALGLTGPTLFEMNLRGSSPSTADVLHIVVTAVLGLLIVASVVIGATLRGRGFRLYSYATVVVMVVFAVVTSVASGGLATGEPTPWIGLWERIDIAAYLLWVAVLSISLLRAPEAAIAP